MQTKIMSIFTRTPLHVGCGSSVGAVDQPVVRERHTGYPVIPGSAIKGVLADLWNEEGKDVRKISKKDRVEYVRIIGSTAYQLFGANDLRDKDETGERVRAEAGSLLVGEGRLLAFPVRSAKGCFAWLTCPLALNRYKRDGGFAFTIPDIAVDEVCVTKDCILKFEGGKVIFEEYPLAVAANEIDGALVAALAELCADSVWAEMPKRLAVVSDELFQYFVENACEIANHNRIDDETGVVANGALFSQENVPSETLFYSVMNAEDASHLDLLGKQLDAKNHLVQIGADITTGLGWCTVALKEVK